MSDSGRTLGDTPYAQMIQRKQREAANERQIGGHHYQQEDGGEQHWDRIWRLYGPGYFVGCITKYLERYPNKDGLKDLEKARHFLDKLIELETAKTSTIGGSTNDAK